MTAANAIVEPIHDRMPVIIKPDDYDFWLNPKNEDTQKLEELLHPRDYHHLASYPITRAVNNPRNDHPSCIQPLE